MATPSDVSARGDFAEAVEAAVGRLAGSRAASAAVILIVALACFLPGFGTLPPFDGDEPSYAVGAREMVASGNLAVAQVQTDMLPWRPHGAQWLEVAAVSLAGPDAPIWVYRIPSLMGGVATALLTWWAAMAFQRPRAALLAGLLVAGSGVLGLQARLAAPDALLVATTTLTAGALARIWRPEQGKAPSELLTLVFWASIGAGCLLKGGVAPAMAAMALLVLSVERGSFAWLWRLRPATGVVVLIAFAVPWLLSVAALAVADTSGPDIAFLTRIGVPFALEAPAGTYTLLAPLLAGPAMTFIFLAIPWISENLRRQDVLFALAWGAPLWLAEELFPEKLPQYVLPAIPAIAWIAGAAIDAGVTRIRGKISVFYSAGPLVWPPTIVVVVPIAFLLIEGWFPVVAFLAFAVAAVLGPLAWFWLRRGKAVAAAAMSMVTVVFIYLGFFGVVVPDLSVLRVSERIVATATSDLSCSDPMFAAAGFPEESLVFVAGPDTLLTDGFGAADFLDEPGCRVAAVDTTQISSFRQRADDLGVEPVEQGRVLGFNLRKMRRVDVHLFSARSGGA